MIYGNIIFIVCLISQTVGRNYNIFIKWGKMQRYRDGRHLEGIFTNETYCANMGTSYNFLEVTQSSITTLPPNCFQNTTYHGIYLTGVNMNKIIPGAFDGLHQLEILRLSQNNLSQVDEHLFNGLEKLNFLDVSNNNLRNISQNLFVGLQELRYVYLQNNKISFLGNNVFDSVKTTLIELDISSNRLQNINRTFHGMNSLTHLLLSFNNISNIAPDSFQNLSSLEHLDLSHNTIKNLPQHVFMGTPKISHLFLQDNILQRIDSSVFDSQRESLTVLNVSSNYLKEINQAFAGISTLTSLYLQHNSMSDIVLESFQNLSSLELLNVSCNYVKQLSGHVFKETPKISRVYFQYNKISDIGPDTFQDLNSLEFLDISHNNIRHLPEYVFMKSPQISHLYFQNNKISSLGNNLFLHQKNSLRVLNASMNYLKEITSQFNGMVSLTQLYLQYNNISTIFSFQDLTSLEYLDISHNNLEHFQYGLFEHMEHLYQLNFSHNRFIEFPSVFLSPLAQLRELRFSTNKILSIDVQDILSHFLLLKKIDIKGNRQWSCLELAKIVKLFRDKKVEVIKGNNFAEDNIRGIPCNRDDLVITSNVKNSTDYPKSRIGYHNDEKLINNSFEISYKNYTEYRERVLENVVNLSEKNNYSIFYTNVFIIIVLMMICIVMIASLYFSLWNSNNTKLYHETL